MSPDLTAVATLATAISIGIGAAVKWWMDYRKERREDQRRNDERYKTDAEVGAQLRDELMRHIGRLEKKLEDCETRSNAQEAELRRLAQQNGQQQGLIEGLQQSQTRLEAELRAARARVTVVEASPGGGIVVHPPAQPGQPGEPAPANP